MKRRLILKMAAIVPLVALAPKAKAKPKLIESSWNGEKFYTGTDIKVFVNGVIIEPINKFKLESGFVIKHNPANTNTGPAISLQEIQDRIADTFGVPRKLLGKQK